MSEEKSTEQEPRDVPLPEPTLIMLASSLASQAMVSLGIFPHPIDGSTVIRLHQGKHLIDTVALLDKKTQATQTEEEKKMFANVLHDLRMLYVAAQKEKQRRTEENEKQQ